MALQPLSPTTDTGSGYVDWCAIAAGAVMATAVSVVLFTFGTAIGLSMVSPYEGEGASRGAYFAALALWTLWIVVSAFMAGGYLTGRLRRRVGDGTEHEVEVRDGAHGLIVWASGVVVAALLLTLGVTGAVGTAAQVGAPAAAAASANGDGGITAYTVDSLFRMPANGAPAQITVDPATGASPMGNATADREEVTRLLTYGLTDGEFGAEDKAHVARLIANRTGMSEAEAQARIDTVLAKAKTAADAARRIALIIGFATAATLLVGAAAGAWAATLGGKHRDQNTDTSSFWRWA